MTETNHEGRHGLATAWLAPWAIDMSRLRRGDLIYNVKLRRMLADAGLGLLSLNRKCRERLEDFNELSRISFGWIVSLTGLPTSEAR